MSIIHKVVWVREVLSNRGVPKQANSFDKKIEMLIDMSMQTKLEASVSFFLGKQPRVSANCLSIN